MILSAYQDVKGYNEGVVVIISENGKCYTYLDDACILWYVLNYNIYNKCISFDEEHLLKVIVKLVVRGISVYVDSKYYKAEYDNYESILKTANRFYELENNTSIIIDVLKNKLDYEDTNSKNY